MYYKNQYSSSQILKIDCPLRSSSYSSLRWIAYKSFRESIKGFLRFVKKYCGHIFIIQYIQAYSFEFIEKR